ncbi:MAG TPA: DUF402 domain-containing protein [Actinopolymorphaceae bacterium]|nr:DUF402 domain-containing protein [Actinopolymorphaceae bacterium]
MSVPTFPTDVPRLPDHARPSGEAPYWEPGSQIWWRYWPRAVRPMRVVRDDPDGLVAWLGPRTPLHKSVSAEGKDIRSIPLGPLRFTAPRATKRDVWRGPGILKVAPTGVPWSVWLFWGNDGVFRSWYVNLEQVHRRDDESVYTHDHILDVIVYPDRRVEWKDEDELAAAVEAGRFSKEQAASYEEDARAVERTVARWGAPFCDGWESWRPDPRWRPATLPPGATATF